MEEKIKNLDSLFSFRDWHGNVFCCEKGKLTIYTPIKNTEKKIGHILVINDLIILRKREQEKYRHWATNSWSVPSDIFNKIDGIWITTEEGHYKILTSKAKENMKYLHFKQSGFERKVYIPVELFHFTPIKK